MTVPGIGITWGPHLFLPIYRYTCIIVRRGDWLWKPANIKDENSGAVVYVGSSLTVHNPLLFPWDACGTPTVKNPVRLYPKLIAKPANILPKISIDYLFFQADQSDCTNLYRFLIDLLPLKNVEIRTFLAKFVALEFSHSWFRMAC